jgi:cell division transport system permease protein
MRSVHYVSPAEGLKEFSQSSGLSEAVAALQTNPLPGVIELKPTNIQPENLENLKAQLQQLPQVAMAKLDMQWVKRLLAIVQASKKFVYGLLAILSLAVLLIVVNTIRILLQRYGAEIRVLKLVGASHFFICRPFLYAGMLYGFISGLLAALLVAVFLKYLSLSVESVAALYNTTLSLQGLSFGEMLKLLGFSMLLGWLGAWIALWEQLSDLEVH